MSLRVANLSNCGYTHHFGAVALVYVHEYITSTVRICQALFSLLLLAVVLGTCAPPDGGREGATSDGKKQTEKSKAEPRRRRGMVTANLWRRGT